MKPKHTPTEVNDDRGRLGPEFSTAGRRTKSVSSLKDGRPQGESKVKVNEGEFPRGNHTVRKSKTLPEEHAGKLRTSTRIQTQVKRQQSDDLQLSGRVPKQLVNCRWLTGAGLIVDGAIQGRKKGLRHSSDRHGQAKTAHNPYQKQNYQQLQLCE